MATQGLVTIKSGNRVLIKVVAGCDGMNARKLANKLKKAWPISTREVYKMALENNFGSEQSLVIITDSEAFCEGEPCRDYELDPLYRETFEQPKFNPRWKNGTADHIVVVEV